MNYKSQISIKKNQRCQTQLLPAKQSPKSKLRILCLRNRPCKRIRNCSSCNGRRRHFFIEKGKEYAEKHGLDTFLTVSFIPVKKDASGWTKMMSLVRDISKGASPYYPKQYIRCIGLGKKGCFHFHYLTSPVRAQTLISIARHRCIGKYVKVNICVKAAPRPAELLGYFYDQNFLPAFRSPERPRGARILSASKHMPCGFPPLRRSAQSRHNTGNFGRSGFKKSTKVGRVDGE